MININLSPIEERENKLWFLPDLILLVLIGFGGYAAVDFYLGQVQDEIVSVNDERKDFERSYRRLKPDLERSDQLTKEVEQLNKKLNSLKQITVSKISRYKPIILLEHLQNLKPEGLWFTYLKDESDHSIIRLTGRSFDNLLVAEFMSALLATRLQEVDANDLRTQVFFSAAYLGRVSIANAQAKQQVRRNDKEYKAFAATQDQKLTETTKGASDTSSTYFPEMTKFPKFEVSIQYKERASNNPVPAEN
ncbi:MAG: PilN domain-containing protein [Oligoflexales bacterium]|nr:PilN domain-containing protein [Oligoflexales bacterium]